MLSVAKRLVATVDSWVKESPKAIDFATFGNLILFTIESNGRIVHIRSLSKAKPQRWSGAADARSPIFGPALLDEPNVVDQQRFVDYLYNFKSLVFDVRDKSLMVVEDPSILHQFDEQHADERLLRGALSR